jgi:cytochrome c
MGARAVIASWVLAASVVACGRRPPAGDPALYEGEHAFLFHCAKCHALDRATTGPSVREIAGLYAREPEGIVRWAKAPGQKRPGAERMPSFAMLGDETLSQIARYVIVTGGPAAK